MEQPRAETPDSSALVAQCFLDVQGLFAGQYLFPALLYCPDDDGVALRFLTRPHLLALFDYALESLRSAEAELSRSASREFAHWSHDSAVVRSHLFGLEQYSAGKTSLLD